MRWNLRISDLQKTCLAGQSPEAAPRDHMGCSGLVPQGDGFGTILPLDREINISSWLCLATFFLALPTIHDPICLGGAVRGQFALPLTMAFSLQMTLDEVLGRFAPLGHHALREVVCAAACLVLVLNTCVVRDARLVYTNNMVKQQEYALTMEIQQDIAEARGSFGDTVAFVGEWHPVMNASMQTGEVLGRSFYEWDTTVEGGTTRRILGLWETLGYEYANPSAEQLAEAEELAETMQAYPKESSVAMSGDLIVVKLS